MKNPVAGGCADDWIATDALERLLSLAEEEAADMVFFERVSHEEDGRTRRVYTRREDKRNAVVCAIKRRRVMNPMVKPDVAKRIFSEPPLCPRRDNNGARACIRG
jgi:hypothetical protein